MPNGNGQGSNTPVIAPPFAQQMFTIASGIAGGAAGFVLARRLTGKENVNLNSVLLASALSAGFTFGAVYLIQTRD